MKHLRPLLVFVFCVHTGCLGNSISENEKIPVHVYDYSGSVRTTTTSSDSIARWTIISNLTMYHHNDYVVAKLDDTVIDVFNGKESDYNLQTQTKKIPKESEVLLQPFVIKKDKDKSISILVKPNEPLWSVNMKKAIASYFNFDLDAFANETVKPLEEFEQPYKDQSIYGDCEGTFTMRKLEPDLEYDVNLTIYKKSMNNNWNCNNLPLRIVSNTLRAPGTEDLFDSLYLVESNKTLITNAKYKEGWWAASTSTNITYRVMGNTPYFLSTIQKQLIGLLESKNLEKSIDISELTEKHNLIYEFGSEPTLGRHSYEKDQSVLVKQYLDYCDQFENTFSHAPEENYDVRKVDPIDEMFLILMNMDNQGFKKIESAVSKTFDTKNFHFSLLSHIGTNASVKYLSTYIQAVPNFRNSVSLMILLATIPKHIRYPTDEILVDLEPWLNLKNMHDSRVKNAGVLSFASVVGHSCKKHMISRKYLTKYTEIFKDKFLGGENYEVRLTYLLGLINMAECLTTEFINGITTNTSESAELRVLALTGFKHRLLFQPSKKIYKIYWPIVQKKSEPFNVRVAALEMLLFAQLSPEHFNSIVKKYSQNLNDPEDRQLANYLITSLHSAQNINWYINNSRGAKAAEVVRNHRIPSYPKDWATGYYRLSYTDNEPNFGEYLDMHLITDPQTNMINIMQLTYNNFAASFDFGTYSVYLNIDGFIEWVFIKEYIEKLNVSSVPELLKLLKENNFEHQDICKNIRFDLIIFVNRIAVYVKHIRNFDQDQYNKLANELDDFVSASKYITYPVIEYVHIPSALGTPILLSNSLREIATLFIDKELNWNYRSSWSFQTWLEAYDPLADIKIASYKYYVDEKGINIQFNSSNYTSTPTFKWKYEDDAYIQFWDNMMGTAVEDEEVLKQYCKECKPYNELPTNENTSYIKNMTPLGVDVHVEIMSHKQNNYSSFYYGNTHLANIDAFPLAGPILYLAHANARLFWADSELSRGSYKSQLTNVYERIKKSQTTLTLHIHRNISNRFGATNYITFAPELVNIDLENGKVLNFLNVSCDIRWFPSKDGEGNKNMVFYQDLKIRLKSLDSSRSFKICANRELFLPGLRSDKLSLEPFETAKAETVVAVAKNVDDNEDCDPKNEHIFTEVFSASDKDKILEDTNMLKDYNQCLSDSKDLMFTAPTAECKRISSRLTEYDNYNVYLTRVIHIGNRNITETLDEPFAYISRVGNDKLKLAILKRLWIIENIKVEEPYYKYIIYFPKKTIDPNWLAYNENSFAVSGYASSTCTITPSRIQQFSGIFISNPEKQWLAFAECYNISARGLQGQTIGDKNIGFTFYSNEHVLTATVIEGKAEIKINGTVQNEYYEHFDDFMVEQLDESVFHVRDSKVDIYYNTEYISVKVPSIYDKLLCGVCTEKN